LTALFVTVVGASLRPILHDPCQHGRIVHAHNLFLGITLLLVLVVIVLAHEVIRHSLRPLKILRSGVERLREGELDVVLPSTKPDEFGTLTEAFNAMARRVREMVAARDRLLLDVSHELRSPLTRMKVALALLPEEEKRRRMEGDVAEMETMIAELLELERLRDGRALRLERQDLVPILKAAAEAFQDTPPGVLLEAPVGGLFARIDAEKVRTVLRNLLENAAKYALPDSAPILLSASREGAFVVVRVRDDGPGIPAADRGSLFEPFFRVDRSRSKKTGGYGLGLSICKRIMEAHSGEIAVEGTDGRGVTFVIRFPEA
jgi:signal transduction histidine kinase